MSRQKITTVREMVNALNSCSIIATGSCYLEVLKSINIDSSEFEKYYRWSDEHPARVSISKTPEYELILSCWEKDQRSAIHDIDSQEAWIHPICGKFAEERFRKFSEQASLEQVSSVILDNKSFSYMSQSKTIYRYINIYEGRSVCLHLYAKPVNKWKIYDEQSGKVRVVSPQLDAVVELY